ncbi:hypothetical protein [Paenibacillus sp. FSL L8-0708]|uniref:hypothetical protein n=1 Tax=Paenibacillus sp. FSL L8-0708 TaxID=2975311 RepID=UPI0030FB1CF2
MDFKLKEGENWDDFIVRTIERKDRNLVEIIELVALDNNLTNVDSSKSIALADKDELFVYITHDNDQLFEQTYPKDQTEIKDILDRASRMIADNMRDSVERLRCLDQY